MSDLENKKPKIQLVVKMSGFDPPMHEHRCIEKLVRSYFDLLIKDLALQTEFTFSLNFSATKKEAKLSPFNIKINGENCRIPFSRGHENEPNCKGSAVQIIEIIHQNRGLLINRTIAQSIHKHYIDKNHPLTSMSTGDFHELIIGMIERSFSLNRFMNFVLESEAKTWDHRHYFDALVAKVDSTNIQVFYNNAYDEFNARTSKSSLTDMFSLMQDGLYYELGVVFPKIKWDTAEGFETNEFQIQINDVHFPIAFGLSPGEYLVNDTVDRLKLLDVKGKEAINPANGLECAIVDESYVEICESAGLTTWNCLGYLVLYTSRLLRKNAGSFLTKDVVKNNLDTLQLSFPALVTTVLSQQNLFNLTWILRDLVDEEISIRDLRNILDNLLAVNGTMNVDLSNHIVFQPEGTNLVHSNKDKVHDLDFLDYSNYIRSSALKRYISHKYTRGASTLVVYLLDPVIEVNIRKLNGGSLSEMEHKQLIDAVYGEVGNLPPSATNPVILTTNEIRRQFRKAIEVEFPQLEVLSYQELSADMNIQPIARISLDSGDSKQ